MEDEFDTHVMRISVFEIVLSLWSKDFLLLGASDAELFINFFSTMWSIGFVIISRTFPSDGGWVERVEF